uniref:Uncharacterized protein n=1 Tax=Daphnia magna TaxID=35525 RepID=A0A0P6FSJ8_9CRUS
MENGQNGVHVRSNRRRGRLAGRVVRFSRRVKMGGSALCKTLAVICLLANLLEPIESLPLPTTTTEPPSISPDSMADASDDVATTESNDSSGQPAPPSIASHVYAILTIFHSPTSPPDSVRTTTDDPNAISSPVVSSSTASLSEDNCSSEAVDLGPCRKRTASFDGLAGAVFSYLNDHVRRSLMEATSPSRSSDTWRFTNVEQVGHAVEEASSDSLGSGDAPTDVDDVAGQHDSSKPQTSTLPTTNI